MVLILRNESLFCRLQISSIMKDPKQLLNDIRKSPGKDVSKYFSDFGDIFSALPKNLQQECADEFYAWASVNPKKYPQHFAYAKFLIGWLDFLCDRHEQSLKTMVEVKKLFEELNDTGGMAITNGVMAGVYRTLGNIDLTL